MRFTLLPILDRMIALYEQPIGEARFQSYLKLLQGNTKSDLALPIGGFNPMAKPHVLEQLQALKALDIEAVMAKTISALPQHSLFSPLEPVLHISFCLADDWKGGWTNRYTTDYAAKFSLNPLISRGFCSVLFWTSEAIDVGLVASRTLEYAARYAYWQQYHRPKTLGEHIRQETAVSAFNKKSVDISEKDRLLIEAYYQEHKESQDESRIFNFLYGDDACANLAHPAYGIPGSFTGFKWAVTLAKKHTHEA